MRYGYARVSSRGQDYAGQIEALKAAGCERIFSDKLSGKSRARPELDKVLRRLEAGDTIVITKVDRIARSVRDLQRRRIAERYAAGETMAELARDYEVGEATVWRALQ